MSFRRFTSNYPDPDPEDYEDCLAQVHEILQKYGTSHHVIVGGDFNEDISSRKDTRRECSLNQIISENRLTTSQTGKTYVGPNGVDTSTIDYVFHGEDLQHRVKEIRIMDDIQSNVSDHYPLLLTVELEVNRVPETNLTMPQSSRIKWDKVYKEAYNATVSERLSTLKTDISSLGVLDSEIRRLNEILIGSAEDHAPKKLKRHRKVKLRYTPLK